LLLEKDYYEDYRHAAAFEPLVSGATSIATFAGLDDASSISSSNFTDPFIVLFSGAPLGPDVVVYRLPSPRSH
jgi:hypothetical protein